jgi:ribosomal protein L12E/L44/L45/RPP1/RPP2
LAKVIKASGNEVEPYWPSLFAKALKGQNIEELLSNIGSAPVAAAGGAPVAEAAAPAKGDDKKEKGK